MNDFDIIAGACLFLLGFAFVAGCFWNSDAYERGERDARDLMFARVDAYERHVRAEVLARCRKDPASLLDLPKYIVNTTEPEVVLRIVEREMDRVAGLVTKAYA